MTEKCFSGLILSAFFLLVSIPAAKAQIHFGITPVRVEHRIAPGGSETHVIEVLNRSPSPLRIRVHPLSWYLTEDGNPVFLEAGDAVPYSCASWIQVNPRDFRLSPDRNAAIRYQISVPGDAETGGYWAGISFENVPPDTPGEQPRAVFSRGRIVSIVYVQVGRVVPQGTIGGIEVSPAENETVFDIALENTGPTYFRTKGDLEILDDRDNVVARIEFPDVPVLRRGRRIIKLKSEKTLPPGRYTAFCKLDIGREDLIGFKKAFHVEEK